MKTRSLLSIILCIYFATSCSTTVTPVVSPSPNPTATSVATNTPDALVAQKTAMLYQQDFESGIPSGIFSWSNWNVEIEDSGNHVYCNIVSDNWVDARFGHDNWTDYAVEMRIKFLELKSDLSAGLGSRMNSSTPDSYAGDLYDGGTGLSFGPPYTDLGSKAINPIVNRWYTLRMEAAGNRIKYFVDERPIANALDSHIQQGYADFHASRNASVCIDDIRVWALTPEGFIAQLPPAPHPATNSPDDVNKRLASHKFPKLFTLNLDWGVSDDFLNQAFYWDLIMLHPIVVISKPDYLGASGLIRIKNPNSVIVTYFSAADVQTTFYTNYMDAKFTGQLKPEWYVRDINGKIYSLWTGDGHTWSSMLNMSTPINTFMPNFLKENVMNTGLVDGIYYDWLFEGMGWLVYRTDNPPNSQIDINNDGRMDTANQDNTLWADGTKIMLTESRKVFPPGSIILGNGGGNGALVVGSSARADDTYKNLLNGRNIEGFLSSAFEEPGYTGNSWYSEMRAAALMDQSSLEPKVPLFMAYSTEENNFDYLRYSLASALLLDGYFTMRETSVEFNATVAKGNWWYDEYSVDLATGKAIQSLAAKGYLGSAVTAAYDVDNNKNVLRTFLINDNRSAEQIIWRRDFQNGIALVNPSGSQKTIDLHGTYRKILGVKDPKFNDGSTVTKITLPAHGGIILLNMP